MTPLQALRNLRQHIRDQLLAYADNKTINALLVNVDDGDRAIYSTLLTNQLTWLRQENVPSTTQQWYLNITKRVIDNVLVLRNFAGIQPMAGPCGLVYRLWYVRDNVPIDSHTQQYDTSGVLQVTPTTLTAAIRKLPVGLNIETTSDASMVHDIDLRWEMVSVIATEISNAIISEFVYDMLTVAAINTTTDVGGLLNSISSAAGGIASTTRRGHGNVIVTSPAGLASLKTAGCTFGDEELETFPRWKSMWFVGITTIQQVSYSVFVSSDRTFSDPVSEKFLIAYKGKTEMDCGAIYSPYIPVVPRGPMIDPCTFAPVMTFATRYAKHIPATGDGAVGNYYAVVTLPSVQSSTNEVPSNAS